MFKAVINAETLRDAIEAVSSLVDEVKFSLSEKGIELKAVDPANVAMVSLRIGAEAFDYFKAAPGEIGVDLVRLSDVLKYEVFACVCLLQPLRSLTQRFVRLLG